MQIGEKEIQLIIDTYMSSGSLAETVRCAGVSRSKVRKTLLNAGIVPDNPRTAQIQEMYNIGMSSGNIAQKLNISIKAVNAHLPHVRGAYNLENPSKNATRIRRWRQKKINKHTNNLIIEKTCVVCGVIFQAGPNAKYCPICQIKHRREYQNKQYQDQKNGVSQSRTIGSVDQCLSCENDYIIAGPSQKYCADCMVAERKKNKRMAPSRIPKNKKKKCLICGTPLQDSVGGRRYCNSAQCRKAVKQQYRNRDRQKQGKTMSPQKIRPKAERVVDANKVCPICNCSFLPQHGRIKYCSDICRVAGNRQYQKERSQKLKAQHICRCGRTLEINPKTGKHYMNCSQCWQKLKTYRQQNPEYQREYYREYYQENREKLIARVSEINNHKPLGRTETCPKCQQAFTVTGRNQKYCTDCSRPK